MSARTADSRRRSLSCTTSIWNRTIPTVRLFWSSTTRDILSLTIQTLPACCSKSIRWLGRMNGECLQCFEILSSESNPNPNPGPKKIPPRSSHFIFPMRKSTHSCSSDAQFNWPREFVDLARLSSTSTKVFCDKTTNIERQSIYFIIISWNWFDGFASGNGL